MPPPLRRVALQGRSRPRTLDIPIERRDGSIGEEEAAAVRETSNQG